MPKTSPTTTAKADTKAAAPKAEETVSYGLPAFRLNGRRLVCFGATKTHCAFYPMSSETIATHKKDLAGYDTSTGTIRFQPDAPPESIR